MTWAYLAVGGFLLGSVAYAGYYTTRYEPEVKPGYLVLGFGILVNVGLNTYVGYERDVQWWILALVLLAYATITAGLVLITLARRRHAGRRERTSKESA